MRNMWPTVSPNERVVTGETAIENLQGGDLMGYRYIPYGDGSTRRLFVVFIDGYGHKEPVCWKAYTKLELEPILIDLMRPLEDASNFRVIINTFSDVRDYGTKLSETDARTLFPRLAGLPYDK